MKIIIAITFITSFFSLIGTYYNLGENTDHNKFNSNCPPNHEKAEETLIKYLESEKNIEELREVYNVNIDSSNKNKVRVLYQEEDQVTCKKLIEKFEWLDNFQHYSFYRVDEFYFIVTYSLSGKKGFHNKGISIINSRYERLAIIININTTN